MARMSANIYQPVRGDFFIVVVGARVRFEITNFCKFNNRPSVKSYLTAHDAELLLVLSIVDGHTF